MTEWTAELRRPTTGWKISVKKMADGREYSSGEIKVPVSQCPELYCGLQSFGWKKTRANLD